MSTYYMEIKITRRRKAVYIYTHEQYAAERQRARAAAEQRRRREIVKERLGGVAAGIGILLMLGAAGAADLGEISAAAYIVRSVLGLALMAAGLYAAHAFYGQEADAQWNR